MITGTPAQRPLKKCPNCGKGFRGHPNRRFCKTKCKDTFHNWRNPRGKFAHLNPTNPRYERPSFQEEFGHMEWDNIHDKDTL